MNEHDELFTRTWYVLHVKPRTEKRVDEFLSAMRVFHCLPLVKKETRVQRRRVVRYLPVFPGYVFTRLRPDERRRVFGTQQVVRTIAVADPRRMIHQLRQIEHASRLPSDLREVASFDPGEHVRMKSGPFRGIEGYVQRKGTRATLVLELEILGRALEVTVDPTDVERV